MRRLSSRLRHRWHRARRARFERSRRGRRIPVARTLGAVAFVAAAFFFGGIPGAVVGVALVLARLRGASANLFWILGLVALAITPAAVLVQGLPSTVATPSFVTAHTAAHALVGVALASLAMAAFLELPGLRTAGSGNVDAPVELPVSDERR